MSPKTPIEPDDSDARDDAPDGEGLEDDVPALSEVSSLPERDDDDPYGEEPPEDEEGSEGLSSSELSAQSRTGVEDDDEPEDATRAGPPLELRVVAGPDAGRVKRFRGVRLVVGRGRGCDLVLNDTSVSRRHLELVRGEKGTLLRDLGSGNGSKVNAERVSERLVGHGDEIAIGSSRILIHDELEALRLAKEEAKRQEEEAARAAAAAAAPVEPEHAPGDEPEAAPEEPVDPVGPTWPRLPARARKVALAAAALLALGGIALWVFSTGGPPPPDPRLSEVKEQLERAREAARADRFEEALRLVERAEKVLSTPEAQALLHRLRAEVALDDTLREIRALIDRGQLDEARQRIDKLPVSMGRAQTAKRVLEEQLERQRAVRSIEERLEAQDFAGARALAEALPEEARTPMIDRIAQVEEALRAHQAEAEAHAAEAARPPDPPEVDPADAFASVARKFNAGEFERAASECDRVIELHRRDHRIRQRAESLKALIPVFARHFREGQAASDETGFTDAVRPLRKAKDVLQKIGLAGPIAAQVDAKLAGVAVEAGRAALRRDDLIEARVFFRDALALAPGDPGAREGADQLAARAEELYLQAYMIRDRDPKRAISLLKVVVEATAPGSSTHEKAREQLSLLQP